MLKRVEVHYCGWGEHWLLGTLADNGSELLFEYSAEALRQGLELSPRHLRLREQAYGGFAPHLQRLPGLIADALPDGWGLLLMDRLFRRNGLNPAQLSPLDRLAFINGRALGALTFEPAEKLALLPESMQLLQLAQEAQALVRGQDSEALKKLALMGGSPQGARPKVLVYFDAASGALGTDPAIGAPWLIKFQAGGEHPEVCALEDLYAQLARDCGIEMPATRYFALDKKLAAFGIERFDMECGLRVPVHTLAGALHADFRIPSSVDYTTVLRATRLFTRDEREVQKAYERAVFNVVFNNRDDHAKNISFRLDRERHWKLAPGYDLTFSEGPGGEHQMDVCGEGRAPGRKHLLELARQGGLDVAWANHAIERMADVAGNFKKLAAGWPLRASTIRSVQAAIATNRARLRG